MKLSLASYLDEMPIIAILRGVEPENVVDVVQALVNAGIRIAEIPLNSPDLYKSIELASRHFGEDILIGAGTVLSVDQVRRVALSGGRLVVSPNMNIDVIQAVKTAGMISAPGVATPTEAFAALQAGADGLKLFPADVMPPSLVKAWRAVLPEDTKLIPVGGVTNENLSDFWQAGANGFGLGSYLFTAEMDMEEITKRALSVVTAIERII